MAHQRHENWLAKRFTPEQRARIEENGQKLLAEIDAQDAARARAKDLAARKGRQFVSYVFISNSKPSDGVLVLPMRVDAPHTSNKSGTMCRPVRARHRPLVVA
jgi:hypothetical protein